MYEIYFYRDKNGKEPVKEYLIKLSNNNDKDSRINLNKIRDYIKILQMYGTRAGEPFVKHIEGDIWELRPLKNRILFVGWVNNSFILLHHFVKNTKRTPKKEIEKAKSNMIDFIKRGGIDEQK